MRKAECTWSNERAAALLASAETVHLATSTPEGKPVLRALHAVYVGDLVAFHGAVAGERKLCLGRAAVVCAERIVANIPSYFVDPERACPATTYYESAQAAGLLVEVVDLEEKARVVEALMQKHQREGGYVPLDASHPLYQKALRGLLVYGVRVEELHGKFQLGQRRKGAELEGIVTGLWQRGGDRDLRAIDQIVAARPEEELCSFKGPGGSILRAQLGEAELPQALELLRDAYWNQEQSDEDIARAHRNSNAWVGCLDAEGRLLGSARAIADAAKMAWLMDVVVVQSARGRGIGAALMRLLLDHPRVRACASVSLATRDAQDFYARFGFEIVGENAQGNHVMLLRRETHRPPALGV